MRRLECVECGRVSREDERGWTDLDGSALRRRYREAQTRAGLRPIRFHDLRHTFGSLAVRQVGAFDVQAYMGHADGRTTARYTHYRSRSGEAERLADAFQIEQPESVEDLVDEPSDG